jgi:hypothetical protein
MKKLITAAITAAALLSAMGCGKKTAPSPSVYATFGEAKAAGKDPDHFMTVIDNNTVVYAACEKDGRYYEIQGTLSDEKSKAIQALDVFDDSYKTKQSELLSDVPVSEVYDFTDRVLSADKTSAFAGKEVRALIDDGFELNGWFFSEETSYVYVDKDQMDYICNVIVPDGFDVNGDFINQDLYPFEIQSLQFNEPAYLPLDKK